jgi:hypothetical protein
MPTKPMHVVHHVNTEIACLAWTIGIGFKYGPNGVPQILPAAVPLLPHCRYQQKVELKAGVALATTAA